MMKVSFQDTEGTKINVDVGISYHIHPDKVADVFLKYRKGVGEITDVELRQEVRNAISMVASKYDVEYIIGPGKEAILDSVFNRVKKNVDAYGIVVEKITFVSNLRPPTSVEEALNDKIRAKQKASQRENEIKESEAAAQIKIAAAKGFADSTLIVARSKAEANKLLAKSLSKELIQYYKIQKWNGSEPLYIGGGTPIIGLSGKN